MKEMCMYVVMMNMAPDRCCANTYVPLHRYTHHTYTTHQNYPHTLHTHDTYIYTDLCHAPSSGNDGITAMSCLIDLLCTKIRRFVSIATHTRMVSTPGVCA
jgi:hypothetical protein